ncbi:Structural origins of high-affinity biotin binding To Streptavidin [Mycena indigotica]|uniref:Structural origins of high-affinity biotin binding To Streptavidin n=1 Tax=Mycena indigotica TaxID=2126181 RepID=A0A8H6S149_9AGAR|nr:Structural origins of high-affinity biotin binding To Streptavidin [Mycena indigotica]KAF7290728.1 Structural origins of high-affinity biotin binding To Streptavidin [Mycena indigotica]
MPTALRNSLAPGDMASQLIKATGRQAHSTAARYSTLQHTTILTTMSFNDLNGVWRTTDPGAAGDYNYVLELSAGTDGALSGYMRAPQALFYLRGRIDPEPRPAARPDGGIAFGWTVSRRAEQVVAESTTGFAAQYFPEADRIVAQWIIAESTTPAETWNSANVGSVVYTRSRGGQLEEPIGSPEPEAQAAAAYDYTRLTGTWYNELGSCVELAADRLFGLSGKYNSSVGEAASEYFLGGTFDRALAAGADGGSGKGVTLGWSVGWNNAANGDSHSASTWAGQVFFGGDPAGDVITTQWLLTVSTASTRVWASTNAGADVFRRTQPDAATVARVKAAGFGAAHPSVSEIVARGEKYAK